MKNFYYFVMGVIVVITRIAVRYRHITVHEEHECLTLHVYLKWKSSP